MILKYYQISAYKHSATAIYVKGQSLFNLCNFEHALIMFNKRDRLDLHTDFFKYDDKHNPDGCYR